jgi:hypothetical protein
MNSALTVFSVFTTRAAGNSRWISSPRLSVLTFDSAGGKPESGAIGFATSMSTLPSSATPAARSTASEPEPAGAFMTISPYAAAEAKSPVDARSPAPAAQSSAISLPCWRAPIRTSAPSATSALARARPTIPVPSTP